MRPCSIETEPKLGKPITSPTAKNVRLLGAIVGIHRNASTRIGVETRGGEIQVIHVFPVGRQRRAVLLQPRLSFTLEIGHHSVVGRFSSTLSTSSFRRRVTRRSAQVITQRFEPFRYRQIPARRGRFSINVTRTPSVANMQVVFHADDATADHDHGLRNGRHFAESDRC